MWPTYESMKFCNRFMGVCTKSQYYVLHIIKLLKIFFYTGMFPAFMPGILKYLPKQDEVDILPPGHHRVTLGLHRFLNSQLDSRHRPTTTIS